MKGTLLFAAFLLGFCDGICQAGAQSGWEKELLYQSSVVQKMAEEGADSLRLSEELIRLGDLYSRQELYSEAMSQYRRAGSYLNTLGRGEVWVHLNNSIAQVHVAIENYELARGLLAASLDQADSVGNRPGLARTFGLLGVCAEKQGNYMEGLDFQRKSLAIYQSVKDQRGVSMAQEHMGSIYEDLGQFELAFDHFEKAYAYFRDKPQRATANLLNNLGDVRRKQGRFEEALVLTRQALDLAMELRDPHQLASAHKDLSKTYAAMGEFEKAYDHFNQADDYKGEALQLQNATQLNVLQTMYETDKKESEIRLLREQNDMNQANQRMLGISAAAMVGLFLVAMVLITRKKRAEGQLQELREKRLSEELDRHAREAEKLHREAKLKTAAMTRYSLHLSHKNKLLNDMARSLDHMASRSQMDHSAALRSMVQEIDHNLSQDTEWDEFMNIFEEIYPEFTKKLNALASEALSPAELRLGMLLRMNLSSKEIASILRVTPDSVRVARYRLRKKLPISQKKELVNFMVEL